MADQKMTNKKIVNHPKSFAHLCYDIKSITLTILINLAYLPYNKTVI